MRIDDVAALLEAGCEGVAVDFGEHANLLQVFGVDVIAVSLHDPEECYVFQAALPRRAQRVVKPCHFGKTYQAQRDDAQSQVMSAKRLVLELLLENAKLKRSVEELLPPPTPLRK